MKILNGRVMRMYAVALMIGGMCHKTCTDGLTAMTFNIYAFDPTVTSFVKVLAKRDLADRTKAGLAAARARGRLGGRPKALDDKQREALVVLYFVFTPIFTFQ